MGLLQLPDAATATAEVRKSFEWVTQMRELMRSRSKGAREELEIADKVLGSLASALVVLQAHEAAETGDGGEGSVRVVGSPCLATGVADHARRKTGNGGAARRRSYYRCTYKHTRGCNAIRQAQPTEDDPSMYVLTYIGHHTCKEPQTSATSNDHSSPIEEKPWPEQGASDLLASPLSAGTVDLAEPKREANRDLGDKDDDFCWKELGMLPDSERSSDVSSSSMYGDVEMFEGFDIGKYLHLEPSEVLLCGL